MKKIIISALLVSLLGAASLIISALLVSLLGTASRAQDAEFGEKVRTYLLENPEVLIEALTLYERKQVEAQSLAGQALVHDNAAAVYSDGFSPEIGNPNGDVTIVKFSDYRCGHCKAANLMLDEVLAQDPNLRVIIKEFPILGAESIIAARYAMAIWDLAGPEAYDLAHDRIFGLERPITPEWVREDAASNGLESAKIVEMMDDPSLLSNLESTQALAQTLGITGTPFFIVGKTVVPGGMSKDDMLLMIQESRS